MNAWGWTDGWGKPGRTDGFGWTDGRIRTDGLVRTDSDGRMDGNPDGRMDGFVDGRTEEKPGEEKSAGKQPGREKAKPTPGKEKGKLTPRREKGVEDPPGEEKGGRAKGSREKRRLWRRPEPLLAEAGAEIVEIIFGLVVGIVLASGFIALQTGLNSMGGTALEIMDNRYAALAVTDMGLEKSEPGGIDAPDDGEGEDTPVDPGEGGSGSGGESGSGSTGDDVEPGELPDVEEEGETGGEEFVDTDW